MDGAETCSCVERIVWRRNALHCVAVAVQSITYCIVWQCVAMQGREDRVERMVGR